MLSESSKDQFRKNPLLKSLFSLSPRLSFSFEKLTLRFHNVMKFCMVNKPAVENTYFSIVFLFSSLTYSAIITRKTNETIGILKCGGSGKESY